MNIRYALPEFLENDLLIYKDEFKSLNKNCKDNSSFLCNTFEQSFEENNLLIGITTYKVGLNDRLNELLQNSIRKYEKENNLNILYTVEHEYIDINGHIPIINLTDIP